MIDFLKGTVGKDYFSDRLYGCQECIAEYLASKEPCTQGIETYRIEVSLYSTDETLCLGFLFAPLAGRQ